MLEHRDLTILIVDDDDVDVRAITRSLRRHNITNPIRVAGNGIEALALLRDGEDGGVAWPFVVLLDLNMPRMDGHGFLDQIRSDPALAGTVVFVLTTSTHQDDIARAYGHHVAGYVVKDDAGKDFVHLVSMIEEFSLVVRFPRERLVERPGGPVATST